MGLGFVENVLFWELFFFIAVNAIWVAIYFRFRQRDKVNRELKGEPLVSVIIPVYNKAAYVKETIKSALNLNYGNKEVIVVNDGSSDGGDAICGEFHRSGAVEFINFKQNQGKSNALNAGIRAAKGDFILTIDADSIIERDAVKKMIRHFGDPNLGAVAGVVKVKNNKGVLPRLQFVEYFQQSFQRLVQGLFQSVLVLPGPISLYRKTAIEKSGFFESATLAEDWDMTLKVHKAGYGVVSEKEATATTYGLTAVKDWWRQRVRWSRGGVQIAKKHKDIFTTTSNKVLKRFVFPLHIIWIFIPVFAMPLALMLMIPTPEAVAGFAGSIGEFFSALFGWVFAGIHTTIVGLYSMLDTAVFNFMDFEKFGLLKIMGVGTILTFLGFTYFSIKAFKNTFTPKNFFALMFMPVYWLMLNVVFLYSLALEVLKRKAVW